MHEDIKRFPLEGAVTDKLNLVENRDRMVRFVEDSMMREQGYVPVLDMDAQYNQWYDHVNDHYEFKLSVYGVYVGKERAWEIAGMMSGKPILRSIQPVKSSQS